MQVLQTAPTSASSVAYSSLNSAIERVSSTHGLRSLWRGVSSVVIGAGPAHAVYFGVYEAMKELSGGNREGHQVLPTGKVHSELLTKLTKYSTRRCISYHSCRCSHESI